MELAREGPTRIACPSCGSKMTEARARGVSVDLCPGCGGAWLDGGELTRLARDLDEVQVAPQAASVPSAGALELDLSSRVARAPLKFQVRCVHCEATLDLTKTNWLINTRPWCPECARPYSGLFGPISAGWIGALVGFFFSALLSNRGWGGIGGNLDLGGGRLNKSPDVLKIVPSDAEKYFAPFFTVVR
jgi:Zn finger protein HypA/HybF involved in hydrogenase expression